MKTNLEKAAPALLEASKGIAEFFDELIEYLDNFSDINNDGRANGAMKMLGRATELQTKLDAAIALAEAPDTDEKGWPYNRD